MLRPTEAATAVVLQLQRELDVIRQRSVVVVIKRVVEDREDTLGPRFGRDRFGASGV